jgi:hypothetical protein
VGDNFILRSELTTLPNAKTYKADLASRKLKWESLHGKDCLPGCWETCSDVDLAQHFKAKDDSKAGIIKLVEEVDLGVLAFLPRRARESIFESLKIAPAAKDPISNQTYYAPSIDITRGLLEDATIFEELLFERMLSEKEGLMLMLWIANKTDWSEYISHILTEKHAMTLHECLNLCQN